MDIENVSHRWFSVMKVFFLINSIPVQFASDCYHYYSYFYGHSGYQCYSPSSGTSAGVIAGIVIGSVVGTIIIVFIVTYICIKSCKKANHGIIVVQPAHQTSTYDITEHARGRHGDTRHPLFAIYSP